MASPLNGKYEPQKALKASWSATADATNGYDKVIAPGTIGVNAKLVEALNAMRPITSDSHLLDVGAGTGSITRVVRAAYPNVPITALDLAPGMVASLREQNIPLVKTGVADATALDRSLVPDGAFTHAVAALMIQFCGDKQPNVCRELFRAVQAGGVAAASISLRIDIDEPWCRACEALDSTFERVPLHAAGAWCSVEEVEEGMKAAGFVEVTAFEERIQPNIPTAEDYAEFWLHGKHPTFRKQVDAWKGDPEEVRPTLMKVLKEQFPDTSVLGAWSGIIVGKKPE